MLGLVGFIGGDLHATSGRLLRCTVTSSAVQQTSGFTHHPQRVWPSSQAPLCGHHTPKHRTGLYGPFTRPQQTLGSSRGPLSLPLFTQRVTLSQGPNTSTAKIRLRTRLVVTLLFGGGLLGTWWYVRNEKQQNHRMQRIEQLKKVALGQGDFSLLDHRGHRRTKRDFLGSWDRSLPAVQPLFVTVDPERDDVAALERYVKDFHPRLIGMTGTPEEVKVAGKDYRVYASPGPKDEDGDYIVDHTILIYLVNPDGLFLDYYNRMKDDVQIAESVRNHMKSYVKLSE
uniref:Synthesis of cytochrome C oxidase 2 n=1 Tax=Salmo trutta TaxID=8032 RepID=A0A673XX84_SALTR